MNQAVKLVVGVCALALLILAASFAYDALKDSVKPDVLQIHSAAPSPSPDGTAAVPYEPPADQSPPAESTDEPPADENPDELKTPDFTAEDADGNVVNLSDMFGKPIVVNFWASWCPPCKAEMPEFERVFAELGDDVEFMMVNMTDGSRETREKAERFVADEGYTFPVYYDIDQSAAFAYGVRSLPTTIFIDSDGVIVAGAESQIDEETLRYGITLIANDE